MENSIAAEMMAIINTRRYKQIVPSLPGGAGLSDYVFPKTVLAKRYTLDVKRWIDGSFMNPSAMFEIFGAFNNETPLQVRRRMMKYLGISKKRGAEECKILKNSWIALHMKGQSAREWADTMFQRDVPGDEILLYTLCKIYHCHAVVFTSANIWTTYEPDRQLTEAELFDACELRFLFIEPGVFGELRLRPAMPPAPSTTMFLEGATDYLQNATLPDPNTISPPLNLSQHRNREEYETQELQTPDQSKCDGVADKPVTGENSMETDNTDSVLTGITGSNRNHSADENSTPKVVFDPYCDARLSGTLDIIRSDGDQLLALFLSANSATENTRRDNLEEQIPEFPVFSNKPETAPKMLTCLIRLDKLTANEIEQWQKPAKAQEDGVYNLRLRSLPVRNERLKRAVKYGVDYHEDSQTSAEEDITVGPGKWGRKRSRNIHVPASGPSTARLAAHRLQQLQKE